MTDVNSKELFADPPESSAVVKTVRSAFSHSLPYLASAGLVGVASALATITFSFASPPSLTLVFLIAVVISANRFGLWPAVFTAFLSVLCWDYYFSYPLYHWSFDDPRDVFAVIAFIIVSLVMIGMTAQIRHQSDRLATLANSISSSYSLSQALSRLATIDELASFVASEISAMFHCRAVVFLIDHGTSDSRLIFPAGVELSPPDLVAADAALLHISPASAQASRYTFLPFDGRRGRIGTVGISRASSLIAEDEHRLDAFLSQAAIAIERAWLARDIEHARMTAETERIRNALLTSVSHDLRTPLTTIIGALSTLKTMEENLSPDIHSELVETARGEAERLNRFVGNLLDITRLESGSLTARLASVDVEEAIDSARQRAKPLLLQHKIEIEAPPDLPEARADFVLLDQVLFNVLDNAAKYSPPRSTITVRAAAVANGAIAIDVYDEGCGIPEEALEKIFEKFSRFYREDSVSPGTGLGLMICRGFLAVMGGTIAAENRADRSGAIISIRLMQAR